MANGNRNGGNTAVADQVRDAVAQAETARATAVKAAQTRMTEIDSQIESLGSERDALRSQLRELGEKTGRGRAAGNTGTRARNDVTLDVAVANVLIGSKSAMSPTEISDAVTASGYTSNSPNFRGMVSQSINRLSKIKHSGRNVISSPGRGSWQASSALAGWVKAETAE